MTILVLLRSSCVASALCMYFLLNSTFHATKLVAKNLILHGLAGHKGRERGHPMRRSGRKQETGGKKEREREMMKLCVSKHERKELIHNEAASRNSWPNHDLLKWLFPLRFATSTVSTQ